MSANNPFVNGVYEAYTMREGWAPDLNALKAKVTGAETLGKAGVEELHNVSELVGVGSGGCVPHGALVQVT